MERTIKQASVEGMRVKRKPTKHVLYAVKMTWSDGQVNVVSRRYSEFYDLLKKLTLAFNDVEKKSKTKIIPQLQGKGINIFGNNAMKRLDIVSSFVKKLFQLPPNICQSHLVLDFFKPTEADLESSRRSTKRGKRKSNAAQKKMLVKELSISGPIAFEEYYANKDWKSHLKNGLDLKKGQVVEVVEKQESGWWFVSVEGEQGWVPKSHLDCEDENNNTITFEPGHGEIYVSTKSYQAEQEDELSVDVGVHLQIIEKNPDGWWKALYCGREGMVPCTYLKPIGQISSLDKKDINRETQKGTRRKKEKVLPLSRHSNNNQSRSDMDFDTVSKLRSSAFTSPEEEGSSSLNTTKAFSLPRRHSDVIATSGGWVPQKHIVSRSPPFSTSNRPATVEKHFSFSGMFRSRPKKVPNRRHSSDDVLERDDEQNATPRARYEESKRLHGTRKISAPVLTNKKRMAPPTPKAKKLSVPTLMISGVNEDRAKQSVGLQQKTSLSKSCPDLAKLSRDPPTFDEKDAIRRGSSPVQDSFENLEEEAIYGDPFTEDESDDKPTLTDLPSIEQFDTNVVPEKNEDQEQGRLSPVPLLHTEFQAVKSSHVIKGHSNSSTSSDEDGLHSSTEDILVTYNDLQNELIKSPQDDKHNVSVYFAKADFKKPNDDPKIMNLWEGEKVVVLEKNPNGWWLIDNLNGQRGWAPSNFLEVVTHSSSDEDEHTAQETPVSPTYESNSDDSGIAGNSKQRKFSDENVEIYRAIAKYNGVTEDGEVDLVKNKTVRVLKKASSGWWLVATDEDIGWAPFTYLEKVPVSNQQKDAYCAYEGRQVSDLTTLQLLKNAQFEVLDEDKGFCNVVVKIPKRDGWISQRSSFNREGVLPQCRYDPQEDH